MILSIPHMVEERGESFGGSDDGIDLVSLIVKSKGRSKLQGGEKELGDCSGGHTVVSF